MTPQARHTCIQGLYMEKKVRTLYCEALERGFRQKGKVWKKAEKA